MGHNWTRIFQYDDGYQVPVPDIYHDTTGIGLQHKTVYAIDKYYGVIYDVSKSPFYSYNVPGDYVITYTAADIYGNTSTWNQNVIIRDSEDPYILAKGDVTLRIPLGFTDFENITYGQYFYYGDDSPLEQLTFSSNIADVVDSSTLKTYPIDVTLTDFLLYHM